MNSVTEKFALKSGMQVDIHEGWKKIISSQFGGNPGRAFSELIQNLIDSYDSKVPWPERKGEIETSRDTICITDYGSGLDRDKLRLLTTLGGTDKANDPGKIGTFGVGFFSIFNPRLRTEWVQVTTRCEGTAVVLRFVVEEPDAPPRIEIETRKGSIPFSTRILVKFGESDSVDSCVQAINKALKYYPCKINFNGKPFPSVWEKAERSGAYTFSKDYIHGFIEQESPWANISMLRKYELIMMLSVETLATGGRDMHFNLDDLYGSSMPLVPEIRICLNCNALNVTISRDSFYLDWVWQRLKAELAEVLLSYLDRMLDKKAEPALVLANHYILRDKLSSVLDGKTETADEPALEKLLLARVYRISGERGLYSLRDLKARLSPDLPLFYSPTSRNLRWLGGNFKHDFIVLPDRCEKGGGAPHFYDRLFGKLFPNAVNLDTVGTNHARLKELVDAGIVAPEALSPECKIVGERSLTDRQQALLDEVAAILQDEGVHQAIEENLNLPIRTIRPVFIQIEDGNAYISAGIFDSEGIPLTDRVLTNFASEEKPRLNMEKRDLLLGLSLNHPFIRYLAESDNVYRAYFSLTYVSHELALSQRMLVPYSPFYHLVKEKLAASMRKALIDEITKRHRAA